MIHAQPGTAWPGGIAQAGELGDRCTMVNRPPSRAWRNPLTISATLLVGASLLLSACGRAASDPASGGLTVGESEKLEAAAHRLDARTAPPGREASTALESDVSTKLSEEKAGK